MNKVQPRFLIFDFFGTLVDYIPNREAVEFQQAKAFLNHLDIDANVVWPILESEFIAFENQSKSTLIEFSLTQLMSSFFDKLKQPTDNAEKIRLSNAQINQFIDVYLDDWNKGVNYLPKLSDCLSALAESFHLAIITNTHHPSLVPNHLQAMGVIDYFQSIFTSVEIGYAKPSNMIFEFALHQLNAKAAESIYIGDHYQADYLGAINAGMNAILVDPNHQYATEVNMENRIDSVLTLPERFHRTGF